MTGRYYSLSSNNLYESRNEVLTVKIRRGVALGYYSIPLHEGHVTS